jgi:hypothetical protein
MANTDTVNVVVEIVDKFSDELRELEAKLDKIDSKRLTVDLDINDGGDIKEIKALLESLEKDLKTNLEVNVRGEKQALALKKALEKDATATITYLSAGGGIPEGGGMSPFSQGSDGPRVTPRQTQRVANAVDGLIDNHLKRLTLDGNPAWADFDIGRQGDLFDSDGGKINLRTPETDFLQSVSQAGVATGLGPDVPLGPMQDRPGTSTSESFNRQMKWSRRMNMARNVPRNLKRKLQGAGSQVRDTVQSRSMNITGLEVAGLGQKIRKSLRKVKPTMTKWMNLIALAIPLLITLAGAALGVVASFVALAGAGAAIVGLGILGYGDSLAESMNMASRRVGQLKSELFDILRPASASFQPLLEGILGTVPGGVEKMVAPLRGLAGAGYGGFFEDSIIGAGEWLGEFVEVMTELSPEIQQIGAAFSRIFGDVLIGLLEWSVNELYNNQEAFFSLGKIVGDILVILYNLSKAVSFALTAFQPLFDILVGLTDLLSNRWSAAILAFIGTAFLAAKSVYALLGALAILKGVGLVGAATGIAGLITMMYIYIGAAFEAIGVTTALASVLSMATLGLSAIAGVAAAGYGLSKINTGPSGGNQYGAGSSYGRGGGGNSMTLVVQGDMSNQTYQRVKDDFPEWHGTRENINSNTAR